MFYYEVAIGGNAKSSQDTFTYQHPERLPVGSIVSIAFRGDSALGFIVKNSSKPSFTTNTIEAVSAYALPKKQVTTFLQLCSLYPYSSQPLAHLFLPPLLPKLVPELAPSTQASPLQALNDEQTNAFKQITTQPSSSFLFGDTGTGKTRVYSHLIKHYTSLGKNVVLLTPEIGLAAYTYQELLPYAPHSVLYHSNLPARKRTELWQRAHESDGGLLIVGPRSALTLPLSNIGLIILDEAHDASYRQDNQPYIHARAIAALLAKNYGAQCVYGTATPNVQDLYSAQSLNIPIIEMKQQAAGGGKSTSVTPVSYDDPNERLPGSSLLRTTKQILEQTFKSGGQALLLMNRRGTARYVSCDTCGHEERCTNCDHLLVYHHDTHILLCHFCARRYPVPTSCSECSSGTLTMRSYGTKAVEEEIHRLFPSVTVKRFDTDTPKKQHLSEFGAELKNGQIQCVIGTQMIAKGLDLPQLTTLVILGNGFTGSGYAGEEREFQLLYQVIGRANRGHRDTRVVIQTYNKADHLLNAAVNRDYLSFFARELQERKQFNYPPFCHLGVIHFSRKSSLACQKAGTTLMRKLQKQFPSIEFIGPLANSHERRGLNYHWHILMKSPKRSSLLEVATSIGTSWTCELDPIDTP